ncbi:alpha/beta hydrolase [Gracilibacillus caseinilyticus]|uniref:Alpha/beta hydrolase n=1 Tax=Gracilibacillus caseinilyticus TaxID=2932256 RepID=A0ABY4EUY3_9BACI|nr:alpha/beta hydrolase [Gracilibacillus caseinilyticus]UOQ48105.1 alpha/beta hydrolase [Gracilibacillus caseinilyticus]
MNTIPFKGHIISYQFYSNPTKPTIILLHGFLASSYCYRKVIPIIQDNFQLLTIDIPPFGNSEKSKSCLFSYDHMVEAIQFIMADHQIETAAIVGHSMGGQIALRCAHQLNQISELYLLAPCSFMKHSPLFAKIICHNPFSPFIARRLLKQKGVYEMLRHSIYNDYLITDEMLEHYKQPFLNRKMYPCIIKILNDHQGDLSEQELTEIDIPVTIFWGKNDEIIPYQIGYELIKYIPHSTLTTVEHAGHLLPEEIPNMIADSILSSKEFPVQ